MQLAYLALERRAEPVGDCPQAGLNPRSRDVVTGRTTRCFLGGNVLLLPRAAAWPPAGRSAPGAERRGDRVVQAPRRRLPPAPRRAGAGRAPRAGRGDARRARPL